MIRPTLFCAATVIFVAAPVMAQNPDPLDLSSLAKLGTVDRRFQSYNVEMVEITGGRFWAPYGGPPDEMYRMRPPVDLSDKRLRNLARPLGPAFIRVSGTWANTTYLPAKGETVSTAPAGFKQVLTRDQWRGVIRFSKAVGGTIVTSFAAGDGTRGADGAWKSDQAQRLVDLTRQAGGRIYAAEFFNEPNIPNRGGLPDGYNAAAYVRDFRIFRDWARKAAPDMKIAGPGGVAEGSMMKRSEATISRGFLSSEDLIRDNAGRLDILSYHYYGGVSLRCKGSPDAAKENALSPAWLDKTLLDQAFYADLRDRFEPGKPMWLNETAQAACGGSPWAATFLDSFRYLNQLGVLAQKGVQSVMHNTLAASDYGLIDQDTLMPRPNYWAAVLWKRTMGTTVLASPPSPAPNVRLFAHCVPARKGGVGMLAINIGETPQSLTLGQSGMRWTMSAMPIDSKAVSVNGQTPVIDTNGRLSGFDGIAAHGDIALPPQSITFVTMSKARNKACY